jgi:hypothetical protein
MPIPQVSVYLDNRPGSLSEAMAQLDRNKIKVFALSIADAGEFGLVRMIAEDPEKATKVLEEVDYNLAKSRKNTEVTAVFITEQHKHRIRLFICCPCGRQNRVDTESQRCGKRGENIESKRCNCSVAS